MKKNGAIQLVLFVCLSICLPVWGATLENLETRVQRLEKENNNLLDRLKSTDEKINATADAVDATLVKTDKQSSTDYSSENSLFGAYGELHYNSLDGENGSSDKNEIDFHRFVLFFNHDFSPAIRFFSELELEHSIAGEGKSGEIELEQAFVDISVNEYLNYRLGLFLIPVGIINETHEPPTFYGVERNPVEKNIIPATWWEGGVGIYGNIIPKLSYDISLHSGLETSADDSYKIRNGRQKVAKATADNFAVTSRLKWIGSPRFTAAATYQYQQDVTQGNDSMAGEAHLLEIHGIYSLGPFELKALLAGWKLDGEGPEAMGADEQIGYYIEPSYKISKKLGVFGRYNVWDNSAGINSDSEKNQWDFGINYWPHPDVVLKVDYQIQDNENENNQDGFNVGLGYQF